MIRRFAFAVAILSVALLRPAAAALTPYLVANINQVPAPDSSSPDSFRSFNGIALFNAEEHDGQRRLWRSDGTEAGTYPLPHE